MIDVNYVAIVVARQLLFRVDPQMDLAMREQELRRAAERARLLPDPRHPGVTARVVAKSLRVTAAALIAVARRLDRPAAGLRVDRLRGGRPDEAFGG